MHLRMFEAAKDHLRSRFGCDVVEGIISPVADQFGKPDLIRAEHRLRMCELASQSSTWIRADGWECRQREWNYTLNILKHHHAELKQKYDDGIRLMLLCGADLVDSFTRIKPDGKYITAMQQLVKLLPKY
jgi:nicotinamide mononucleotide adenylyltransferase